MRMRMTWVAVAAIFAVMMHADVSAQRGYETFNRALAAEKADSDLRAAIRLYEQAIREAGQDRQLAARALLRIGECYRRLGDAQARTAFTRIVNEYADQAEVVTEARARLQSGEAGRGDAPVTARLTTTLNGSLQFDGHISADGRLGGTDWSNGDVMLVDVITGRVSRIVAGVGRASSWGEQPVLSPDKKQVAYSWYEGDGASTREQLRVLVLDPGAQPRVLMDDPARIRSAHPVAWSADGRRILVGFEMSVPSGASQPPGQGDFQLAWVSAADGTIIPIKRFEWWRSGGANSLGLMSLSPDGRHIAYSAVPSQGSRERTVYVMGIDGKTQSEVATGGVNQSPVWTPDGRQLLFESDHAGGFGLWAVAVRDGRATTQAAVIKANTGRIRLHGFSGGLLYYSASVRFGEIFVRPIERDGRLSASSPTQSIPGIGPVWSPDGKFLALKRPRADGSFEVVLRNSATAQEHRWSGLRGDGQPMGSARPVWLGNDRLRAGVRTLLELSGGELRLVVGDVNRPPIGNASRSVLYELSGNSPTGGSAGIAIIDAATRQQKGFFAVPNGVEAAALSPSGEVLAVTSSGRLSIIGVDGRQYRELFTAAGMNIASSGLDWSPDGRFVIFGADGQGNSGRVMRVSVSGGAPEPVSADVEVVSVFDVSPDGTRIAYDTQKSAVEIWSLEIGRVLRK